MIILIDSRERAALKFECDYKVTGLKFADYGASFAEGHMYPVVFERKSCGDLFNTLTGSYDRFKRMFLKAEKAGFKVIIAIEGTREKILKGYSHSARDPKSIVKQLETIRDKYNVEHIYFPSRIAMQHHIHDYYYEKYQEWKGSV